MGHIKMSVQTIKSLLQPDGNASAQKIGFLLLNDFSMLAFASAIEPLRAANRQSNSHLYDWVIASPSGDRPLPATASRWRPMATPRCFRTAAWCLSAPG